MITKIGRVELSNEEAFKLYQDEKYIVQYKDVYQLHYSNAQKQVYGQLIYKKGKEELPFTKRGRFITTDGKGLNKLIGRKIVNE